MPRPNQSDSRGKGSSRSRGKSSGGRAQGKSTFRKRDQENPKSSSGEGTRSFGNRRSSGGPPRPRRKSDENERPFTRSAGSFKKEQTPKPFGKTSRPYKSDSTGERPFKRSGGGFKREQTAKPFGKTSRPYKGDSDGKSFSQKSRFAKKETRNSSNRDNENRPQRSGGAPERRREERGGSFGKPYKKVYRSKADRPAGASIHKRHLAEGEGAPKSDKIRLNKFIANSGISSRREADELIKMGLISVNGNVITELGYKVNPGDEVRYESKVLRAEKPVYILMNKPKGFITTTEDPQERKTIMHIVGSAVKERIYPVGRLDRNTTGLLLLTNDGDLADKLMHPSFNVKKVYKVELDRPLAKADFQTISEGVRLEEGRATVDDLAIVSEDGRTVGVELHIGWNRVVRRIFESLDYEVVKLDRTVYAGLDKKELARGQWRFLTKEEIIHLKHFK
jgi:23S rRNA pseudouridine2605 synthase